MSDDIQEMLAPDLRWFECNGIHIAVDLATSSVLPTLGLAVESEAAVMDLIDAVLLDEQDSLLRFLDDWCSTTFDWRPWKPSSAGQPVGSDQKAEDNQESVKVAAPVPLHELRGCPRLTSSLVSLEGPSRTLLLAIDEESLAMMPPVPEVWQQLVEFRNHVMPYRLHLQHMELDTEEVDKLSPGALVLLPQSFESIWPMSIKADTLGSILGLNGKIRALLDVQNSRIKLLPESGDKAQSLPVQSEAGIGLRSITVELEEPMPINELYARSVWQSQLNLVLALPRELKGSRAVIRSSAESDQHAMTSLTGTLMQVGTGYGVLLEHQVAPVSA